MQLCRGKEAAVKTALTIAGSDPSGGAGIQADIKTMTMHGIYAMSAITALTAQNTTGITGIMPVPPEFLQEQIEAVCSDIRPDAVKIGMLCSGGQVRAVAGRLKSFCAANIVVDPVMASTSGTRLMDDETMERLKSDLFPLADLVTPNIPELAWLSGMPISSKADRMEAAGILGRMCGCAVLCKGGHGAADADDLLFENGQFQWFLGTRIDNPNSHGTGCTLSSAIAANLAKGYDMAAAVQRAKEYVSGALLARLDLGHGRGPLNHAFCLKV